MSTRPDHRYFMVAHASAETRALFIRRTYEHVAFALFAFFLIEGALIASPVGSLINRWMVAPHMWLICLALYLALSWGVYLSARSNRPASMLYASLALYLAFTPPVLVPLIRRAAAFATPQVVPMMALVACLLMLAVSLAAFTTGRNFTHARFVLKVSVFLGAGLALAVAAFGFNPALGFAAGLVIFSGGILLAATARIMHQYAPHQHLAASMVLLASSAIFLCRPRLIAA